MNNDKKPVSHPVTLHDIDEEIKTRVAFIDKELSDGFNLIKHQPKSVTFFGSARLPKDNPYYEKARRVSAELAKAGYSIVTGGGPGIMEAANRGAFENHGRSIGLNIRLPHEQKPNPYITPDKEPRPDPHGGHSEHVTHEMSFYYFFTRKVMLSFSAEAYLYFPGGFGTLDEFFEILTLVQTRKIEKVPLILVGTEFWNPILATIKDVLLNKFSTIDPADLDLFTVTDDEQHIVDLVKAVPIRNGIRLHFKGTPEEHSAAN